MEFVKVVTLLWLPFKLAVCDPCCEAFVNRGKISPSSLRVLGHNVNFGPITLVSSACTFSFNSNHGGGEFRGLHHAGLYGSLRHC